MNTLAPLPPQRILVVEDETMIAMMMEDMLCDLGCAVLGPVASVAPALNLIQKNAGHLDGALLDVNLLDETVYPVAAQLTERNVPFAFVRGCASGDIDPQFRAIPLLQMPVKPTVVEKMLNRFRNG